eukprot:gene7487-8317_t
MAAQPNTPRVQIEIENSDLTTNKTADNVECKPMPVFKLTSLGKTIVDRRYSVQILQWVVREISQADRFSQISVNLSLEEDGLRIETTEESSEHLSKFYNYERILKLPRLKHQERWLAFVTLGQTDTDQCCCHAFECKEKEAKLEILKHLKSKIMENQNTNPTDTPQKKLAPAVQTIKSNHRRNLSYGGSAPQTHDDAVHRFSIFYVGKVTISQAKAPPHFLDEIIKQIKIQEAQNHDKRERAKGHLKNKSTEKLIDDNKQALNGRAMSKSQGRYQTNGTNGTVEKRLRSASDGDERCPITINGGQDNRRVVNSDDQRLAEFQDAISARVVTFQISMSSLMLFSAGNKQLLLEKKIREISFCTKAHQRIDHFGFICREKNNHVLYLFQGESENMVDTIMRAMKQAFNDALQASAHLNLCDSCPIQQLSKMLTKLEGAPISEQQACLQEHLQGLTDPEYHFFMNRYNSKNLEVDSEKIALVIYLLRAVYDQRQKVHQHNYQGMHVSTGGHQAGLEERERSRSTFFEKAKKSFTSSFDNLLMRRQRSKTCLHGEPLSVDTVESNTFLSDSKKCLSPNLSRSSSEDNFLDKERQRSRTFNSCPPTPEFHSQTKFVIPENEAETKPDATKQNDEKAKENGEIAADVLKMKKFARQGSWRQQIYNTVTVDVAINDQEKQHVEKKLEPRALAKARWQKAIQEQIILIRMEKENKNLAAKISATETRRQKLSYEVLHSCSAEAATIWDGLLAKTGKGRVDVNIIMSAVKAGVPKYRRGEVWRFLVQQHSIRSPKKDDDAWKSSSYQEFLDQPTSHQHAIRIDLGRTFPAHIYFNGQLGPGQLSLFNILKCYSILDSEVGYCQGLSFVAGVILMHMSEVDTFGSFCYAMYNLGIRNQYKPDMMAVQQQLYQLSRLLHDFHPNIYEHFNIHDVTPTLYAAPWFLTLFASHYPVAFVVRVMDLIFLQGLEVIFKIALALFSKFGSEILANDCFESIIEFMKVDLPKKVKDHGEDLISEALEMDIKHELNLFEVEYQLLHEEMIDIRQNRERYEKLELANKGLKQEVNDLKCELDYVKENADMNAKSIAYLTGVNEDLRARVKDLETENQALKINARLKNGGFERVNDSSVISPASSEVDEIMHNNHYGGLQKKDSTDGHVPGMEKSWELVPSPTTVNFEMTRMVESFETDFSPSMTGSSGGDSPASDVAFEKRKPRPTELITCKSLSSDSNDFMDLISFDSPQPKNTVTASIAKSSSDDVLLKCAGNEKEAKPLGTIKRPALPIIETNNLLATCNDKTSS